MLADFKKFALRGNVVDMAVGFTVGAAFATIARSLVDDLLMPPLGLLLGGADLSDRFWLLRAAPEVAPPYATLADAQAAGAVTMNYGLFLNAVLTFLIIALAVYLLVRAMNRVEAEMEERFGEEPPQPGEPADKKCRFCLSTVPFNATRCPFCTSQLEAAPKAGAGAAAEAVP
jgi:large conductance mechanosensitive channel